MALLCMGVDYQGLNIQTTKDRYTLPQIDDLLVEVLRAANFSPLD